MIRRAIATILLSTTPLLAAAGLEQSPAYAAGGTTDSSFGSGNGFAAVSASDTNARFFAAPTGEPVITTGGNGVQWDADGKTISGWTGNSGISFPTDAAIDSSGRVVVIGGNSSGRLNVARFSNGVLDSSFGTGGVVNLTYGPNGSLVTTGSDGSVMVWADGFLVKLSSGGVLDPSWNPSGTTPGVEAQNAVWGMRFQSDGHLVVVCPMNWQQNDPCLDRFNADGSPDTSFGGTGKAPGFAAQGLGQTEYWSIAIANDDSIYAGGADLTNGHAVLAHYTADGSADTSFGDSGVTVNSTPGQSGAPQFRYLALSGSSIYAGMVGTSGAGALARYTLAGQADPAFAANGQVGMPVPQPNNTGTLFGIGVQSSGKPLVAIDSGGTLYVYRFNVDGVDAVSGLNASATTTGASLSWTNPSTPSFNEAIVRVAAGQTAPASATSGTALYQGAGSTTAATLTAGRDYAASVFVSDFAGNTSAAATILLHGTKVTTTGSKTLIYGNALTVGATLKTLAGASLPGRPVTLYSRPAGASSWSKVTTLTTNSSGAVSRSVKPTRTTAYQFAFSGAAAYLRNAAQLTVTVKPHMTTSWGPLTFPHTTGTYVKGTVAPAGTVELQRLASGVWRNVAKTTVAAGHSAWRFTVKPSAGTWTYRVFVPAQGGRAATASSSVRLNAR